MNRNYLLRRIFALFSEKSLTITEGGKVQTNFKGTHSIPSHASIFDVVHLGGHLLFNSKVVYFTEHVSEIAKLCGSGQETALALLSMFEDARIHCLLESDFPGWFRDEFEAFKLVPSVFDILYVLFHREILAKYGQHEELIQICENLFPKKILTEINRIYDVLREYPTQITAIQESRKLAHVLKGFLPKAPQKKVQNQTIKNTPQFRSVAHEITLAKPDRKMFNYYNSINSKFGQNELLKRLLRNKEETIGQQASVYRELHAPPVEAVPKRFEIVEYPKIVKHYAQTIKKLHKLFRKFTEFRDQFERSQPTGLIDQRRLPHIILNLTNTPFQIPQNTDGKLGIMIVTDNSGSMSRENRSARVREATIVLTEAIQNSLKLAVYGHTSHISKPINFLLRYKGFHEKIHKERFEAIDADFPYICEKDSTHGEYIEMIGEIEPCYCGDNRDGYAILDLREKFQEITCYRRFMIIISDGLPLQPNYKGEAAIEHTRMAVKSTRENGIDIFALSLNSEDDERLCEIYGKSHVISVGNSDLTKALTTLVKKIVQTQTTHV